MWGLRGQESLGQILLKILEMLELLEAVEIGRGEGRPGVGASQVRVGRPLQILEPRVQERELTNLKQDFTTGNISRTRPHLGGSATLLGPVEREVHWKGEDVIDGHLLVWLIVKLRA